MPSTTPRTSSNCCISREPPSPDGLAPRPTAPIATATSIGVPAEHAISWTSADVNELQAIFEAEQQEQMNSTDSIKLHRFRADAEDDLERELSESEADLEQIRSKKSSHTLKAVTEKLRKHLSVESALAKRHSRSSIGTTDEETRRRAELRRIRQRRIQEELSNESIYDDDAKSLSSLLDATSGQERKESVPLPENFIPLLDLTTLKSSNPVLVLPDVEPVTVEGPDSPAIKSPGTVTGSIGTDTTLLNSDESIYQTHNSPFLSVLPVNECGPKVYIPSRKPSSISEVPDAPTLGATRPPSMTEPDNLKSPWRLSFSSERRSEGLRNLSHGSVTSMAHGTDKFSMAFSVSGIPPYSSGSKRHAANLTASSEAENSLQSTESHTQICCSSMDFGGVDGGGDISSVPHVREMDISQRLASKGLQSSVSSPQLSSWGSHQRGSSTLNANGTPDKVRRMRHTEDLIPSIDGSLQIWGEIKIDKSPFRSSSAAGTAQSPIENYRFKLLSFLPKTRTKSKTNVAVVTQEIEESDVQEEIDEREISVELPGLATIRSSTATPIIGASQPIDISSLSPSRRANDDNSFVPSETSSFREREEELRNLQSRFTERRVVSTPVSSKFREEFDKPDLPSRKPSVLERLARLARRSYDGTVDGTVDRADLLDIPLPSFEPSELLNSPNLRSPLYNDDAEIFWGSAIKSQKGKDVDKEEKKGKFGRKKSTAGKDKKGFGFFGKKKKGVELSAAEQYQKQFEERMAVKELVMDSWEMEMEATAAKAKTKSRNIVRRIKPTAPDFRFPASWARFPSHNRGERVSSANTKDKVDVKDFANLGVQENGDTLWCLAHDDDGHHTIIDGLNRKKGVGERFIEKVEKELYEFDTRDDQREQTSGRRGSLTVACELEYPELEILPLTLMDEAEMQKQEDEKEEFETAVAKDEELDEIAKLLGGGFDGVMSGARDAGACCSAGASDWEDEMVMSSSDEREMKPQIGIWDPNYYADCVVTKSTFGSAFASEIGSPIGSPGGTIALRADVLEELLRIPGGGWDGGKWRGTRKGKGRDMARRTWSGEDWDDYVYGKGEEMGKGVGDATERKWSLGTLLLSKSVSEDDLMGELVRREEEVRSSLLKAVEDAFGRGDE